MSILVSKRPWPLLIYSTALLTLAVLLVGCGGSSGSSPEGTVRDYFDALSEGNSERLATLFVPEVNEGLADATLPPITITNLVVEVESATSDSAQVLAEYDADFPVEAHTKLRFILVNREGEWLISDAEALEIVRDDGIVVQVLDEDSASIVGARVTIVNAEAEMVSTLITDSEGLATFEGFPEPDNIVATKEGYTPSRGWSFFVGEPWKVALESIASLQDQNEHLVLANVDPLMVSIPQGGSASATATLFSFARPSRITLSLLDGSDSSDKFFLVSDPVEVVLPETGQAQLDLEISTFPEVPAGIYRVDLSPQVQEDFRPQGQGEVYGGGGQILIIKVDAAE